MIYDLEIGTGQAQPSYIGLGWAVSWVSGEDTSIDPVTYYAYEFASKQAKLDFAAGPSRLDYNSHRTS
jgi:hypothetical protein